MVSKVEKIKFELKGQLPAKKNSWRKNKYGFIYQSKQKEIDAFILQLKPQTRKYPYLPFKCNVGLFLGLWQSNRTDLDNQITTICDILQQVGIVENDRQIKQIIARKFIDNKHPRINIRVEKET